MKVNLIANRDIVMDGNSFASGDCVGTIDTDLPPDCLQSLAQVCVLSFQPADRDPKPTPKPASVRKSQHVTADPPDDQDDADDENQGNDSSEPFAGLAPKMADSLEKAGYKTVEAVREYIAQGKDLIDLPGIGKAAKNQILAWLESV